MIELDDPRPSLAEPTRYDPRWLCCLCGCLALLNVGGLCRECQPERVLGFSELMSRVVNGETMESEKRWRIGRQKPIAFAVPIGRYYGAVRTNLTVIASI